MGCFSQTTELISEFKGQLGAQLPRLRTLRAKKIEDPGFASAQLSWLAAHYFEGSGEIDAPDDISVVATEVSTSASNFTRYTPHSGASRATRVSSKNRRREERKRARGKKGTIYEEEYLVSSIGRLVQRVEDVREDISRLINVLMMINKRSEAGIVQKSIRALIKEIRACLPEVFAEPILSNRVSRNGMIEEVTVIRDFPVVLPFNGSQLLV